jgi:hypothetical protein
MGAGLWYITVLERLLLCLPTSLFCTVVHWHWVDLCVLSWCTLQCVTLAVRKLNHVQLGSGEHMALMRPTQKGEGGENVWDARVQFCHDVLMWNFCEVYVKSRTLPVFWGVLSTSLCRGHFAIHHGGTCLQ